MPHKVAVFAATSLFLAAVGAMSVKCPPADCGVPLATSDCLNVSTFLATGSDCHICRVCLDEVSKENLVCPYTPLWFPMDISEPRCNNDSDCGPAEKCCQYFGGMHCFKGLDKTPKPGFCLAEPEPNPLPCMMDYVGCKVDSQCEGTDKCCLNVACGYNQCKPVVSEDIPSPPIIPRQNLACPASPFWFPIQLPEPVCSSDSDCQPNEKCCYYGDKKHCRTGIDMTPKSGVCPAQVPSAPEDVSCIADFPGCQYDSECSGTDKCCLNVDCGYSECKSLTAAEPLSTNTTTETPRACTRRGCSGPPAGPECKNVETVRPNGDGCEPVCKICRDDEVTRKNLACPESPFWFSVQLPEPICSSDEECQPTEKCCYYGDNKHCRQGIGMTPKPGICPAQVSLPVEEYNCVADAFGCQYDAECSGTDKCCQNVNCGYSECMPIVPRPPPPPPAPLKYCTEIGCGPAPGPECQTFQFVRPNGEGCEPVCRVCADMPTTTTVEFTAYPESTSTTMTAEVTTYPESTSTTTMPRACTRRGCSGPQATSECKNVEIVRPNGEGCDPVCRICRDEDASRKNLDCPTNPFFFHSLTSAPQCNEDSECGLKEKCCFYLGQWQCKAGISKTPKPGSCPGTGGLSLYDLSLDGLSTSCLADYAGCKFDSECQGSQKCCHSQGCPYNQCTEPLYMEACTEIGCGPDPGPECQNIRLVRPNGPGCEPQCRVCDDPPTSSTSSTTSAAQPTAAAPVCQVKWELVCTPNDDSISHASVRNSRNRRTASSFYRPNCRYTRKTVCE